MALDGILFYKIKNELAYLETGKINKIQEASDSEFLFTVRRNSENFKVLISLSANYPRIHITNELYDFPREPKSFTMLLRKYFEGSQINSITTNETDRVMIISCSKFNDMGDFENKKLIVEILGRYSNLIITENDTIIEAFRHIGISEMRSVLPNGKYSVPDTLGKLNPFKFSKEEFISEFHNLENPKDATSRILGLSYQLAMHAFLFPNPVEKLYDLINENTPVLKSKDGKLDFSFYQEEADIKYNSFSELLDDYYKKVSLEERIKAKTGNLESFITKQINKNEAKKTKLAIELQNANNSDKYRLYGELLIAYNYMNVRDKSITVLNYYDNSNVTIPLDPRFDLMGNSKLYFKKYQKAKNAISHINEQLKIIDEEIEYFIALKAQISVCDLKDALEIQQELIDNKYLIPKGKIEKLQKTKIATYIIDGTEIMVGKNNIQNDMVTHKLSTSNNLWFHVKDAPGSHVVIKKDDDYTEAEIRCAANLAAYFSTFSQSSSVPVNYTKIKYIKKIPGRKGCFVSIKNEKTIYIDPDINLINKLEIKK